MGVLCMSEHPSETQLGTQVAAHPGPTVGLRSGSSSREGPLANPTAPNGHFQTSSTSNGLLLLLKGGKKPLTDTFSANGVCKIVIYGDHFALDKLCRTCGAKLRQATQARANRVGSRGGVD